jgi:NADPH2:quinone reductase
MGEPHNSGDDIAGTIHKVGDNVVGFHVGDRVAAFHQMMSPHGSFAEYAVAHDYTTFHLPKNTSFEEGASIPLACMTAAVGLFKCLGLPEPWQGGAADGKVKDAAKGTYRAGPLLVYGAASAVGTYAIQLAKRAGIGPIIGVAGKGIPYVQGFLDESAGDRIVDYREGDEKLVESIKKALDGKKLHHAYDAVSEKGSFDNIAKVLDVSGDKPSTLTHVLPLKGWEHRGVATGWTMVGCVHGTPEMQSDFGQAWFTLFGKGLKEGWLKAHAPVVIEGGLNGVEEGLRRLKAGEASAVKYVFRIGDTA